MSTKINTTLAALRRSGGSVARDAIETLAAVATERDALLAALIQIRDMDYVPQFAERVAELARAAIEACEVQS